MPREYSYKYMITILKCIHGWCTVHAIAYSWDNNQYLYVHHEKIRNTHTISPYYTLHLYHPPWSQSIDLYMLLWCVWLCVCTYMFKHCVCYLATNKTYLYLSHTHTCKHFVCLSDPNILNGSALNSLHYRWPWWNMDDFGFPGVVCWAAVACWVCWVKRLKGNMDLKTKWLWPACREWKETHKSMVAHTHTHT